MKARDAVSPVITVAPTASVKDVAKILLERRISAVPVVDDQRSSAKVTCCTARNRARNADVMTTEVITGKRNVRVQAEER